MLKYELFNIVIVIRQPTAKILTLTLMVISFLLAFNALPYTDWAGKTLIIILAVIWVLSFDKIQNRITTAVRGKFITGWYDETKLLEQVSVVLENENNRTLIFERITQILRNSLKVERFNTLLAVRGGNGEIAYYTLTGINNSIVKLPCGHPTIKYFSNFHQPTDLASIPEQTREFFEAQGYIELDYTLAVPFFTNDHLEAIVILGARSTGINYSDRDIAVIQQLTNYINPVFYRLTSMEILEKQYINTKESLHNAKIQLLESEKMASLGQMVAGVAHELGTPLACILNASSFLALRIDTLDHNDAEFVNDIKTSTHIIESNCKKSASLINSFKQVAVDLSHYEIRDFQLHEVLTDITVSLRHKIENYNLRIEHKHNDISMHSYPGAIDQLIHNLINNTLLHAYEQKAGDIKIATRRQDNNLILTYTDYGKGIAEDELSRIFDPFYTTKQNKGGTGLGLHIAYNLVTHQLNGSIQCKSKVGQYTTFTIVMPICISSR